MMLSCFWHLRPCTEQVALLMKLDVQEAKMVGVKHLTRK